MDTGYEIGPRAIRRYQVYNFVTITRRVIKFKKNRSALHYIFFFFNGAASRESSLGYTIYTMIEAPVAATAPLWPRIVVARLSPSRDHPSDRRWTP